MHRAAFSQRHKTPLSIQTDSSHYLLSQPGCSHPGKIGFVKTCVGEGPTFPASLPSALVPWALLRSITTHSLLSLL